MVRSNSPDSTPSESTPPSPGDASEILEVAWESLEDGDAEAAWSLIEGMDPKTPGWAALAAFTLLGLGDLEGAWEALGPPPSAKATPEDDLALSRAAAELCLFSWRLEEARERFEAILAVDPQIDDLERLALLDDLDGEFEAADLRLAQAEALDPEGSPPPPRLSPEDFHREVESALEALPDELRAALGDTSILVEAMPAPGLAREDPQEVPPDILGLFSGTELGGGDSLGPGDEPPVIHLFQRNLERLCRDLETLRGEIRVTLYHEIGHLFGFDEEGVDGLGLA